MLVKVQGTPLAEAEDVDPFDFIRTLAVARIIMPQSHVRLSAGREQMNEQMQALAFLAGANSIFYGEKLLTTANPRGRHGHAPCSSASASSRKQRQEHADEVHQAAIEQALVEQRDTKLFHDAAAALTRGGGRRQPWWPSRRRAPHQPVPATRFHEHRHDIRSRRPSRRAPRRATCSASARCWRAPRARRCGSTASRCWPSAPTTTWAWPAPRGGSRPAQTVPSAGASAAAPRTW